MERTRQLTGSRNHPHRRNHLWCCSHHQPCLLEAVSSLHLLDHKDRYIIILVKTTEEITHLRAIIHLPCFFFPALASFSALSFSFAIAEAEAAISFASGAFSDVMESLKTALRRPM